MNKFFELPLNRLVSSRWLCSRSSDARGVMMRSNYLLKEWKIFDPRDPLTAAYGSDLLAASVTKRAEGWWMVMAGQRGG